jgi:excisionase family DNA binding protein
MTMTTLGTFSETFAPTEADARLAQASSRQLTKLMRKRPKKKNLQFRFKAEGGSEEVIAIPGPAFRLLADMLTEMGKGNGMALIPVHSEVTTQQAADLLNVSRPFLIEQLEKGAIPFRKVGSHRRIFFRDVMAYKNRMNRSRLKALGELSAIDQGLGLGY